MVIFNALGSVFSIVLMISTGFFLSHNGWFDEKNFKAFFKISVQSCYPLPHDFTIYRKL